MLHSLGGHRQPTNFEHALNIHDPRELHFFHSQSLLAGKIPFTWEHRETVDKIFSASLAKKTVTRLFYRRARSDTFQHDFVNSETFHTQRTCNPSWSFTCELYICAYSFPNPSFTRFSPRPSIVQANAYCFPFFNHFSLFSIQRHRLAHFRVSPFEYRSKRREKNEQKKNRETFSYRSAYTLWSLQKIHYIYKQFILIIVIVNISIYTTFLLI